VKMDLVSVVQSYLLKVLSSCGPGMKVLLLDSCTTPIISLAFPQSRLMRQEVFLFERLQQQQQQQHTEDLRHLQCVAVLRPSQEAVSLMCQELARPRYGSYRLYFTHVLPKASVKLLAEADMQEVVTDLGELYMDFLALAPHLYSLAPPLPLPLQPLSSQWGDTGEVEGGLARATHTLAALLLATKVSPCVRHQAGSQPALALATSISHTLTRDRERFSGSAPSTLLILDRREDPVTPLLSQWTYQAMLHQLLTINNNRLSLAGAPGVPKDLTDIVLCTDQDEFYATNLYSNFGEIGQTIKLLMEEFQNKAKSHQKIDSIADMKNFVEHYPQFKKMSGTVSKHVTLVSELSRLVAARNLLEISELEQEIVSDGDLKDMSKRVSEMIQSEKTNLNDAMRLCMLYALRFENTSSSSLRSLLSILRKRGGEKEARFVQNLLRFAGQNVRKGNLFADQNNTTRNITGKLFKGLKGVENVYTQHTTQLKDILEDCVKSKLKDGAFPAMGPSESFPVKSIVVFIVGGFTYEEAYTVHQLNSSLGVNIVLGGTSVVNSNSFVDQIDHAFPVSS